MVSGSDEVENGMEDKRSENGESLPSINFFLSASAIFRVARLASNFSVRNFSYNTSFVLTFNIIICVDNTAVLNAAKSQWSGFRTSIVPHRNFLTNTPLRSSGGPSRYGRPDGPYPSPFACMDLSSPLSDPGVSGTWECTVCLLEGFEETRWGIDSGEIRAKGKRSLRSTFWK